MDESLLAVVSDNAPRLSVYDAESMARLPVLGELPNEAVTETKFSADGGLLAFIINYVLFRYSTVTWDPLPPLLEQHIRHFSFSPDNRYCAATSSTRSGVPSRLYLYSLPSWELIGALDLGVTSSASTKVVFSHDSEQLALLVPMGSYRFQIRLCRVSDLQVTHAFPGPTRADLVMFTPDNSGVLVGYAASPWVNRYVLPSGAVDPSFSLGLARQVKAIAYNHDLSAACFVLNAPSTVVDIFTYDTSNWEVTNSSQSGVTLYGASFSSDGKLAVGVYIEPDEPIPPVLVFDALTLDRVDGPTVMSGLTRDVVFSPTLQPPSPLPPFWTRFSRTREFSA